MDPLLLTHYWLSDICVRTTFTNHS
uniref:Uncharacterized protein n=1 Tax=Anguilla anguilla TaxID=7936 RepID=A0A0E9RWP4_ANGAN